jgi:hypothetical protein
MPDDDSDFTLALEDIQDRLRLIGENFTIIDIIARNYSINAMKFTEWSQMSMACQAIMNYAERLQEERGR